MGARAPARDASAAPATRTRGAHRRRARRPARDTRRRAWTGIAPTRGVAGGKPGVRNSVCGARTRARSALFPSCAQCSRGVGQRGTMPTSRTAPCRPRWPTAASPPDVQSYRASGRAGGTRQRRRAPAAGRRRAKRGAGDACARGEAISASVVLIPVAVVWWWRWACGGPCFERARGAWQGALEQRRLAMQRADYASVARRRGDQLVPGTRGCTIGSLYLGQKRLPEARAEFESGRRGIWAHSAMRADERPDRRISYAETSGADAEELAQALAADPQRRTAARPGCSCAG